MNIATVNIGVQLSLQDNDFIWGEGGVFLEVGLLDNMVVLFLISWRISALFHSGCRTLPSYQCLYVFFIVPGRREPGAACRSWWVSWPAWSTHSTTFSCWRLRASQTHSPPSWVLRAETSFAWATASLPLPSSLPDNWKPPSPEVAGEQELLWTQESVLNPWRHSIDSYTFFCRL